MKNRIIGIIFLTVFVSINLWAILTKNYSNSFLAGIAGMCLVTAMGSIETAFLLVFSSFMTSGEAMSTLMLFRIASYYFVFAASAAGTFAAQKHLENS